MDWIEPKAPIFVNGQPAPQGSKRHVGNGRMVEASKKVGPWREAVVSECLRSGWNGQSIDDPVWIDVTFFLTRPKSHLNSKGLLKGSAPLFPKVTPDLDKLVRSTFDWLTQCGVLRDDARVVRLSATKRYIDTVHPVPGASISLRAWRPTLIDVL